MNNTEQTDDLFTIGEDTYDGKTFPTVKIFDWNVYRVFRDTDKNILKIVLEKDGIWREFTHETKWVIKRNVNLNDPEIFVLVSALKESYDDCHDGAKLVVNDLIEKLEAVRNE